MTKTRTDPRVHEARNLIESAEHFAKAGDKSEAVALLEAGQAKLQDVVEGLSCKSSYDLEPIVALQRELVGVIALMKPKPAKTRSRISRVATAAVRPRRSPPRRRPRRGGTELLSFTSCQIQYPGETEETGPLSPEDRRGALRVLRGEASPHQVVFGT